MQFLYPQVDRFETCNTYYQSVRYSRVIIFDYLIMHLSTNNVMYLDKKDYVFRSFWDREDCYRILSAFLIKFKGGAATAEVSSSNTVTNKQNPVSKAAPSSRPRTASTEDADHVFDTGMCMICCCCWQTWFCCCVY